MRGCIVVLLLAACGRLGFDPLVAPGDDDDDAAVMSDGTLPVLDGALCGMPSAWSTPVMQTALDSPTNDWSPTLSGDTFRIVFQSSRAGGGDLYEATRSTTTAQFGAPVSLTTLNTASGEQAPALSFDGLELYFTSNRAGPRQLFRTTRASVGSAFVTPAVVTIAGVPEVYGPAISGTGRELFFNDPAEQMITRATFDGTRFVVDRVLTELGNSAYPSLSPDELTIYFSRISGGQHALYTAKRSAFGAPFASVTPIAGVDMAGNEDDPEIGKDDRTFAFANEAAGNVQLYVTTRSCGQ